MESKDEVHSDDGSFELVNLEDYGSETDHMNTEAFVSGSMDLSDDDSYDLLCSEVSYTLVLTEGEMEFKSEPDFDHTDGNLGFKRANDSVPMKGKMGIKGESHSYAKEGDIGMENANDFDHTQEDEVDEYIEFDFKANYDSKVQAIPNCVNKGKKRDLMAMLYESSNLDYIDFPDKIRLKDDIKVVAKNHITRYLPAKSLFKCRLVSKEWNQWISSPFFTHTQSCYFKKTSGFFQNSKSKTIRFISLENFAYGVPYPSLSFLPKPVFVKCSCNGLLLCQSFNIIDEFYVCNPANKQWVKLIPSHSYHGRNPKFVLAFEPSQLNFEPFYQVICLFSVPYPDVGPVVQFDIYDSKTKSWRVSEVVCADLESDVMSDGIFLSGVVYWETQGGELLAYDSMNEIYSIQKLPFNECGGALTNFHGELSYVRAEYDHSMKSCTLDVYGVGGMFLKDTINVAVDDVEDGEFVNCKVLGNSCGDVVALVVNVSWGQKRLFVYQVRDKKVEGPEALDDSMQLFPYVNSLVSLEAF
ncbi:hypothetical protein E3N88_02396 [Mikania micrantha]|uniref:Uncharacterized protein n=1 Tax=Mikania micrantha TaxID=192012 RepID=A0A5N6Q6C9_9ASTR|nr:hypothetical protein E3N88_02396 [Mikania micrantha]